MKSAHSLSSVPSSALCSLLASWIGSQLCVRDSAVCFVSSVLKNQSIIRITHSRVKRGSIPTDLNAHGSFHHAGAFVSSAALREDRGHCGQTGSARIGRKIRRLVCSNCHRRCCTVSPVAPDVVDVLPPPELCVRATADGEVTHNQAVQTGTASSVDR